MVRKFWNFEHLVRDIWLRKPSKTLVYISSLDFPSQTIVCNLYCERFGTRGEWAQW